VRARDGSVLHYVTAPCTARTTALYALDILPPSVRLALAVHYRLRKIAI
jgi:hypothetical protein